MEGYQIVFYQKRNGDAPGKIFIESCPRRLQSKITLRLQLIQDFGTEYLFKSSKPLRNGIFELRFLDRENQARILYFFFDGRRIVITNGFIKKTKKTPEQEIQLALEFKKDFSEQEAENDSI